MTHSELKTRLKSFFQSGDTPTASQFAELIDAATDLTDIIAIMAFNPIGEVDYSCDTALSNLQELPELTVDGQQVAEGEVVLLTAQLQQNENQLYTYSNNQLVLLTEIAGESLAAAEIGWAVKVKQGQLHTNSYWFVTQSVQSPELGMAKLSWTKRKAIHDLNAKRLLDGTIDNARLPHQIDLTEVAEGSKVTAGEFEGDGAAITNLSNSSLPHQIDLTEVAADSKVTASEFEGDGAAITNLSNSSLPHQIDLTEVAADSKVTASEFEGDGAAITNLSNSSLPHQIDLTEVAADSKITAGAFEGDGAAITNLSNSSLPHQIDLTEVAADSKVTASAFEGDGAAITNLSNSSLPHQIDLTEVAVDSKITAGAFEGDGAAITNLSNSSLPHQIDLTEVAADSKVTASAFEGDGSKLSRLNADSILTGTLSNDRLLKAGEADYGIIKFADPSELLTGTGNVAVSAQNLKQLKDYIDTQLDSKLLGVSGEPQSSLGEDGDMALNTENGRYYLKQSGAWIEQGNFTGPRGERGIQGVRGPAGDNRWSIVGSNTYITTGNVGIGIGAPSTKLDVNGQVRIRGGSPAQGKVLTSDSNGLASWQFPQSNEINLTSSKIHYGSSSAFEMTAFGSKTGLWIESGSANESSGIFLNGDTMCLWSPGDSDLLNIYEEDARELRFKISDSGHTYCDGSFHNGGADYAELFESNNGKAIPVGTSVVLEEGKIRPAVMGELPIGVISVKPSVLGNNPLRWHKAYQQDEYGSLVMEQINEEVKKEVLDDEGNVKVIGTGEFRIKSRPVKNPDYDPELEYISREERVEWNCVGLLGQIPITKNQPKAPSWIKMKDISDNVEMWLIK